MKFSTKSTITIFLTIVLIISGLTIFGEAKKEMKMMVHDDEKMMEMKMNLPDKMHDDRFGMNMHMLLDLTEEQDKKIHEMRIVLRKEIIDITAAIEKLDIDFHELILNNASAKTLIKKMEDIGKMKMDIEKKKIENLVKTRDMLNEEQKEILNKMGMEMFGNEHRIIMKKHIMDGKDMKFKEMEGKR